jgi:hypothetical protein
MAIYPYFSTTIINKDVLTNSSFKAGMALIMNSNGMAIKADSQSLVFDSVYQKYGRFLGFAASDHDISGNTIIIPDVIGSNYLDSNYNFIKSENTEYSVPKRSLLDYQDSAISNFYNATDLNPISKRGIGVYNTPGDYFVTDQFNPVLHGDYGVDSTTTTTLNPGDLLTFGGGVNAGKLVKVNLDSFGPDVMVLGQVFKHLPSAGLLYFRQVNYRLNYGSNLIYDLSSPLALSGSTIYDFSGTQTNGTLTNGPAYSSTPYPSLLFDGTNDYINISNSYSANFQNGVTIDFWVRYNGNGLWERIIDINSGTNTVVMCVFRYSGTNQIGLATATSPFLNQQTGGMLSNSALISSGTIQHFTFVIGPGPVNSLSPYNYIYLNGVLQASSDYLIGRCVIPDVTNRTFWIGRTPFNDAYLSANLFSLKIYNQALTAEQILSQHNSTKGRYGL